ncbi:helix-turn-helix transcriptional regulator [Agromyces sp. G08B096]|uniref:Helix-turn-helix transcriptional regulator n=1 Tax=Agromyces sp. G08B096 TaxID=3156399 RepID=A0AAU7W3M3_9MICO
MVTTEASAGVAEKVRQALREQERNITWLSRKTGIPYSTLWVHLTKRPENLTFATVVAIAEALALPVSHFAVTPAQPTRGRKAA